MTDPLAYFLTWHTYGTWFHGDGRGSVDRGNNVCGEPFAAASAGRERFERGSASTSLVRLDAASRAVVLDTILAVCRHRGWSPHAVHVRTTHVHIVVMSDATAERTLNDLKAYATRRLREVGRAGEKMWSRHGSTRYVWSKDRLRNAVGYVVDGQGAPLVPGPFVSEDWR